VQVTAAVWVVDYHGCRWIMGHGACLQTMMLLAGQGILPIHTARLSFERSLGFLGAYFKTGVCLFSCSGMHSLSWQAAWWCSSCGCSPVLPPTLAGPLLDSPSAAPCHWHSGGPQAQTCASGEHLWHLGQQSRVSLAYLKPGLWL